MAITEADEGATTKLAALANYAWQVEKGETMGVIDMYERAARDIGCTSTEIDNTRALALRRKDLRKTC